MNNTTDGRITETERTALTRLLAKAKAEGVKILRNKADGRHFASSVSTPGRRYLVTGYSCECRGFVAHGRCKHYAALLASKGWLDAAPMGTQPFAITYTHVDGHYSLAADPEWVEPVTTIQIDSDDEVRVTGDTFGLSVHWIEDGRPIDDLTGCTPATLDHYGAVAYWIESLDARVPAHVPMQHAGIFPAGEFVDADHVAA